MSKYTSLHKREDILNKFTAAFLATLSSFILNSVDNTEMTGQHR